MIGGIRTDVWGRTSLPGLFAAGECASSGVHGANRLASNSLLEAVVFARRIVDASLGVLAPPRRPPGPEETEETEEAPPVESRLPAPRPSHGCESRPDAHLGPGARPPLGAGQHHPRRGGTGRGGGELSGAG